MTGIMLNITLLKIICTKIDKVEVRIINFWSYDLKVERFHTGYVLGDSNLDSRQSYDTSYKIFCHFIVALVVTGPFSLYV